MKFNDIKIKFKLIALFILTALVPSVILSLISENLADKALSHAAYSQLEAIKAIKKNQIQSFFEERILDAKVLAANPFTAMAFKDLNQAMKEGGGMKSGGFRGHTQGRYDAPDSYKRVHDNYFGPLETYMNEYGYYDLFLIDADRGEIVFSVTKEGDFAQITSEINSSLKDVWQKAVAGETALSDTKPYAPSAGAPAQFVASPIRRDNQTIGVLALQISIDAINHIMQEREGMGETGETYLVGSDKLMRSDSFLDQVNHTVINSFANPAKGSVDTEAANEALSGKPGEKVIIDYNGNPVLSAYDTVKIGESVTWAILAEKDEAEVRKPINALVLRIAIATLTIILVVAVFAYFISQMIAKPIIKSSDFASKVADGDLTQSIDIIQKDEIGMLAKALNSMVVGLNTMMNEIKHGSSNLNTSSQKLSETSTEMAASAEQTSGMSNTVAVAAEEMSANMSSVAAAAEQAATNVNIVATAAEEMTSTIAEIAGNTEKTSQMTAEAVSQAANVSTQVDELGRAAKDISEVTETITEISDQTNLLALNATIEAARAGEAGKGFAVVANEIKELAKQTAEATLEIKSKIEGVQGSTETTVSEISKITQVIEEVNTMTNSIATAIEEQSAATREIAENVSQASQGIEEVTRNVSESSVVAKDISSEVAGIDQAAGNLKNNSGSVRDSAEELNEFAKQLDSMVSKFKV